MLTVGASLFVAVPAMATFGAVVQLPADPIYSPFRGPVTVLFTFDEGDPARVFTLRLRRPGHGTIKEKDVLIDPGSGSSPMSVSFSFKELSVSSPTDYLIDVRRQGDGPVMTRERFTLLPKLVFAPSASPSPFYPIVQDGFRDTTRIGFSLSADTAETIVHIREADTYGRCCGADIRTADLGPLPRGDHTWSWNGMNGDAAAAAEGRYFVKVQVTDTNAVSMTSRAVPVELATGMIRRKATKEKKGSAFAGMTDERATALGGDCIVSRDAGVGTANVLCANAAISIFWTWKLDAGERIESVGFKIDGGYYGCHAKKGHTTSRSILRVSAPPTSTCTISTARITYSYRVHA